MPTSSETAARPSHDEDEAQLEARNPVTVPSRMTWFHEMVTAAIAVAITSAAIWMLLGTFRASHRVASNDQIEIEAQEKSYTQGKDVMLYGLSLLSAIIGYYFGRAPGELRARDAQRTATRAEDRLQVKETQLTKATRLATDAVQSSQEVSQRHEKLRTDVKQRLSVIKANLSVAEKSKTLGPGASPSTETNLDQARREVDDLLASL